MKSIGLVISDKQNESRRALIPDDIKNIKYKEQIFIEVGYGEVLGYSDSDYISEGIGGVCLHEDVLKKDIICDPKIGDSGYIEELSNQTVFGWIHAVQNRDITDAIVHGRLTAFAWEDMYADGRHCFWRNNEIAGEAAIIHAYLCHGVFPYNTKVAIIGNGNVARGAVKTLNFMGAEVTSYTRRMENLLRKEIGMYDVVVNAILWDTKRDDHIIYRSDLARMKRGAMIIDISCDRNGGVETSVPTTLKQPTYFVDGIRHYVVDHSPTLFYKTASESLSKEFVKYIDFLITDNISECEVLKNAMIIENGHIIDTRIFDFQKRH